MQPNCIEYIHVTSGTTNIWELSLSFFKFLDWTSRLTWRGQQTGWVVSISTISIRCKILKPGILYDGKKNFFKNVLILIDLAEQKNVQLLSFTTTRNSVFVPTWVDEAVGLSSNSFMGNALFQCFNSKKSNISKFPPDLSWLDLAVRLGKHH